MYTPSHIANFMLDCAEEDDRGMSPMKLLKLVYIGYGWSLAVLDEKLFEEPIVAWAHGPVVKSLYHEFKHYGRATIGGRSVEFNLDEMDFITPRIQGDDKHVNVVLKKVWDVYKKFSATDLRNKTHEVGTPWREVYAPGDFDTEIPDDLIKKHFTTKIRQYLANAN